MNCSACGKPCRKRERAFVLGLGMSNVCSKCIGDGLTVCKPPSLRLCKCGNHADVCQKCVDKKAAEPGPMQKAVAKHLRQLAAISEAKGKREAEEYDKGKTEGLEQAADILEAWGRR